MDDAGVFVLLLIAVVFGVPMGGCYYGMQSVRIQAVERGYATWTPDEHGWSSFTWIEPTAKKDE